MGSPRERIRQAKPMWSYLASVTTSGTRASANRLKRWVSNMSAKISHFRSTLPDIALLRLGRPRNLLPLPSLLRVSDAGRSRRCGLDRGRRPKAAKEGTRGKCQAVARRALRYGFLCTTEVRAGDRH